MGEGLQKWMRLSVRQSIRKMHTLIFSLAGQAGLAVGLLVSQGARLRRGRFIGSGMSASRGLAM